MLAVTREKLMAHLQAVPSLVEAYAQRDPSFVQRVLAWLAKVEQTLLTLRHPLASLAATQRAAVLASADGLRQPEIAAATTGRKAAQASASLALGRTEAALRQAVAAADDKLGEARDKLAQLLAVATGAHPIPLPPTEPRSQWLEKVWQALGAAPETQGMHRYLGAAFSGADRLYLLDELLENLLGDGQPA